MRRACTVGVVVAVGLAIGATPAIGAGLRSLSGEHLTATNFTWTCGAPLGCKVPVTSFHVAGVASGPYPGTFSETATWTEKITNSPNPIEDQGILTSYTAHFIINGPAGHVHGVETLDPSVSSSFDNLYALGGTAITINAVGTHYSARVSSPNYYSNTTDRGTTAASFSGAYPSDSPVATLNSTDVFTSTK